MPRLVALLILAMTAAPALAQVINGETPLDDTTLNRETPGPAVQTLPPATRPSPATTEPSRSDPPSSPRRD